MSFEVHGIVRAVDRSTNLANFPDNPRQNGDELRGAREPRDRPRARPPRRAAETGRRVRRRADVAVSLSSRVPGGGWRNGRRLRQAVAAREGTVLDVARAPLVADADRVVVRVLVVFRLFAELPTALRHGAKQVRPGRVAR